MGGNVRRFAVALAFAFMLVAVNASAQVWNAPVEKVRAGATSPATCSPTGRNLFVNTTGTPVMKLCTSANTWTDVISGVGGALTGPLLLPDGSAAAPSLAFATNPQTGFWLGASTSVDMGNAGQRSIRFSSGSSPFIWVSKDAGYFALGNTVDTILARDAANILALRNGTNAQTFRVYNTYTDASNYERGMLDWSSNVLRIGTEAAGTGTTRTIAFSIGAVNRWIVSASAMYPVLTNTQSLGRATEFLKDVYIATSIQGASQKTLTESSATAFVQIDVAAGATVGGTIEYTIEAMDATDQQARSGILPFAAVNKAGTETCTIGTVGAATEVVAVSVGTLTNTFTCTTTPTNGILLNANAVSSLTQTTLRIYYRVNISSGTATVTGQ